mgnify:CR=1 FL=1
MAYNITSISFCSFIFALTILSLRGGWITEGIEVADTNYFTDKFEFRKGEAKK